MQILKFGGTSLGTVEAFEQAINIISEKNETTRLCVVVSALSGITNQLEAAITNATLGGSDWQASIEQLRRRHSDLITKSLSEIEQSRLNGYLDRSCFTLIQQLSGIRLLREASAKTRDAVLSSGEYLSAELLGAALRSRGLTATVFDPAGLIRTDTRHGRATVDFAESSHHIYNTLSELPARTIAVVGGFIGGCEDGVITTLGRGGSDYSASIIASVLGAEHLEIWTDVDGVMNADPKTLHSAKTIRELSYRDAENLSRLGAKVLHPKTIEPLLQKNIPLLVRNTFKPYEHGTRISRYIADAQQIDVITSQNDLSLLTVLGLATESFPQILAEVYTLLEKEKIPVLHCETDRNGAVLRLLLHTREATSVRRAIESDRFNSHTGSRSFEVEQTDQLSRISLFSSQLPFRHAGSLLASLERNEIRPLQIIQSNLQTFSTGCYGIVRYRIGSESAQGAF